MTDLLVFQLGEYRLVLGTAADRIYMRIELLFLAAPGSSRYTYREVAFLNLDAHQALLISTALSALAVAPPERENPPQGDAVQQN